MKKLKTALVLTVSLLMVTACGKGTGFEASSEIHVITREPGSGTRGAFIELFGLEEKQADGSKKDLITVNAGVENNTNTILSGVRNDEYAIGYISMGSMNDTVKALKINQAEATPENVKAGTYKISRPFIIATSGIPEGANADFIDFIMSKQGQEITAESYISVDDNAKEYSGEVREGDIVVGGSSSVSPLMEKLSEEYKKINPGVNIQIQTTDSTTGMSKTIEGAYDIGMSSREMSDNEKESLTGTIIALDGISVIVNNANPLTDISSDAVRDIYLGTCMTWDGVNE